MSSSSVGRLGGVAERLDAMLPETDGFGRLLLALLSLIRDQPDGPLARCATL